MDEARKIEWANEDPEFISTIPNDIDTPVENSSSDESDEDTFDTLSNRDSDVSYPACSRNQEDLYGGQDSPNAILEDATTVLRSFTKRELKTILPTFTEPTGTVETFFENKTTATDIFLTVFNDGIVDDILTQTNLYISQSEQNIKPVSKQELYGFIGLQFLFGYHRLPNYRLYWAYDIDLNVPIVTETMSRDRHRQILSNLHLNDNSTIAKENKDKLYKIRPLIVSLNESYQKLRLPDQYQSIDEIMIRLKNRSSLKKYNPMKSIKRSHKLWCRADMSGYVYNFDVYQGNLNDSDMELKMNFGLRESTVQTLTNSLKHKNHIIVINNQFTSINLLENLKSDGILACGTIRPNSKGLPHLAPDRILERVQFDYKTSEQGISFFKWKENRSIYLLSNFHGTESSKIQKTQKDGTKIRMSVPKIIQDYNTYIGGVDKADILRTMFFWNGRGKKWWHRLFFSFLEMSLVNSYVIYKDLFGNISFLEFKRKVTQGLLTKARAAPDMSDSPNSSGAGIEPSVKRKKLGFSVGPEVRLENRGGHWPEFVRTRARCKLCAKNNMESRPHSRCSLCKVFLYINEKKNCFYNFHLS